MSIENDTSVLMGKAVLFSVSSLEGDTNVDLARVLAVDRLLLDKCSVAEPQKISKWEHLKDICFKALKKKNVDLLIVTDHKHVFISLECRVEPVEAPDAMKTPLGWVLYGPASTHMVEPLSSQDETASALCVSVNDLPVGPPLLDPSEYKIDCGLDTRNSHEDRVYYAMLKKEAKLVEGHVQLPLLWRYKNVTLPNNQKVIESRLSSLKRRLLKDAKLHQRYTEAIKSYFEKGYAEPICPDEEQHSELSRYLSH